MSWQGFWQGLKNWQKSVSFFVFILSTFYEQKITFILYYLILIWHARKDSNLHLLASEANVLSN